VSLAIRLHCHVIEKICILFDDLLFIKCASNISNNIFCVSSNMQVIPGKPYEDQKFRTSLFELQGPDSALPLKLNLESETNSYFESTLPVKLNIKSETNSYLKSALPVKLNLDLGHSQCNLLKHLKVYFGGEADSANQIGH